MSEELSSLSLNYNCKRANPPPAKDLSPHEWKRKGLKRKLRLG